MELKITNLVKFYTILLLSDGPKHGYEIIMHLGHKLGKKASPGQIYPFLQKLQSSGYVAVKSTGLKDKKVYALTNDGRKFVKKMLLKFEDLVDIAIEPRLTTCAHCGCKVYEGAHEERIKGKTFMFCCCHCARSFKE